MAAETFEALRHRCLTNGVAAHQIEARRRMLGAVDARGAVAACARRRGARRRHRRHTALNDEQARDLAEGNRRRARYDGAPVREADLTLVLAWWAAYRLDRAERQDMAAMREGGAGDAGHVRQRGEVIGAKARRARTRGRDPETGIRLDAPVEVGISGDWPAGPRIVALLVPADAKGAARRWPSVDVMLDAVAPMVVEVHALLDQYGSGHAVVVSRAALGMTRDAARQLDVAGDGFSLARAIDAAIGLSEAPASGEAVALPDGRSAA